MLAFRVTIQRLPSWLSGKESTCQGRRQRRHKFDPWVRKIPWRRARQPTPVFLPQESRRQRSLEGYSSWGHKRVGHNLGTKQQPQSHHLLSISTTTTITPGLYPYPSFMLAKVASGMQFLNSDSATWEGDLGLDRFLACMHAKSFQSCSTLCGPMDCSPPGFSVHGILQARIPEWVVISFSRGSSQPRDRTQVSYTGRQVFYHQATREAPHNHHVVLRVKHPASITPHRPRHTGQMRTWSGAGGQTELTPQTDWVGMFKY